MTTPMKNFVRFSLLLIIAIVGGHGALWLTSAHKLETALQEMTESQEAQITYTSKRIGYPLSLGLELSDVKTAPIETGQEGTYLEVVDGTAQFFTSLGKMSSYEAQLADFKLDIKNENHQNLQMTIGDAKAEGSLITQKVNQATVNNVSIVEHKDEGEKTIAIIKSITSEETQEEIQPRVFNREWLLNIAGITLYINNQGVEQPITIENFNTHAQSVNWPSDDALRTAVEAAQEEIRKQGSASTEELKKQLAAFIQSLEEHKSIARIKHIKINGDNVALNVDGEVHLIEGAYPNGHINIDLQGLQELGKINPNTELSENPLVQSMINGENELKLQVKLANGMISVNNIPLFPIPSLHTLTQAIPPYIKPKYEI